MKINPLDHTGLIISNMRYYKVYADMFTNDETNDLIQECYLIILLKSHKYNPDKGAVTTFLVPWIQQAMRNYLRKRSFIRVPVRDNTGQSLIDFVNLPVNSTKDRIPHQIGDMLYPSPEEMLIGLESCEESLREYTKPIDKTAKMRKTQKYFMLKDILEEDVVYRKRGRQKLLT